MFEDAVQYPLRGEKAATAVIIGGALAFLWFLLIPTFFVFGYLVRVLTSTATGEDYPPAFEDWGRLGIDGLIGSVFVVVFYLIPVGVFVLLAGVGTLTGNSDIATAGTALAVLVSVPLFIVFVYIFPAVLSEFVVGYRGGQGFQSARIVSTVTSLSYLFAWLIGFAIQVAVSIALLFLGLIPLIGLSVFIIGPFVGFVANVAAFRAFGIAYRSASPTRA